MFLIPNIDTLSLPVRKARKKKLLGNELQTEMYKKSLSLQKIFGVHL